ncbi:hypothetical protein D3C73_1428450 [compost metagenome]
MACGRQLFLRSPGIGPQFLTELRILHHEEAPWFKAEGARRQAGSFENELKVFFTDLPAAVELLGGMSEGKGGQNFLLNNCCGFNGFHDGYTLSHLSLVDCVLLTSIILKYISGSLKYAHFCYVVYILIP